jgi:hypothetical protein
MPERSDGPYLEVGCSEIHQANTFERYSCMRKTNTLVNGMEPEEYRGGSIIADDATTFHCPAWMMTTTGKRISDGVMPQVKRPLRWEKSHPGQGM